MLLIQVNPNVLQVLSANDASPLAGPVALAESIVWMNFSAEGQRILVRTHDGGVRSIDWRNGDVMELDPRFHDLRKGFLELEGRFAGRGSKKEPGEKEAPTVEDRLFSVARGVDHSTYGPTPTHRRSLEIATSEMAELREQLATIQDDLSRLVEELIEAGSPWIEGEPLDSLND